MGKKTSGSPKKYAGENVDDSYKKVGSSKKGSGRKRDKAMEKSKKVFDGVIDATASEMSKISSAIQDRRRNTLREVDKMINSPGATKCLMDSDNDDDDEAPKRKKANKKMTRKGSEGSLQKQFSHAKGLFVEASGKIQRAMSTSV